jgi:hypothetical protein
MSKGIIFLLCEFRVMDCAMVGYMYEFYKRINP